MNKNTLTPVEEIRCHDDALRIAEGCAHYIRACEEMTKAAAILFPNNDSKHPESFDTTCDRYSATIRMIVAELAEVVVAQCIGDQDFTADFQTTGGIRQAMEDIKRRRDKFARAAGEVRNDAA